MGCACKNGSNDEINSVDVEKTNILVRIFNFILIIFLIVIMTPFLMIGVIVMAFNQTVLNKTNKISDIIKVLLYFKEKIIKSKKNSNDDDEIDFDGDDFEIVGVEKIDKNE